MLKKLKRKIAKKYLKKQLGINLLDLENQNLLMNNNVNKIQNIVEQNIKNINIDNIVNLNWQIFNTLNMVNNKVSFLENIVKKKLINDNEIFATKIQDQDYWFSDGIFSNTVKIVSGELNDENEYNFKDINFKKGDCVIDIGGNVGMISIFLAKKFPFLKIYAFEPVKENYENFLKNIKLNNIPEGTIIVENKAVTKDGRKINMSINPTNKGGSSISDVVSVGAVTQEENCNIDSITLEEIFKKYNIKHLKLLKIDCEGSEYEIIYNTKPQILKSIEHVRGEFHENKKLTDKYDVEKLIEYLKQYIDDIIVVKATECFVM